MYQNLHLHAVPDPVLYTSKPGPKPALQQNKRGNRPHIPRDYRLETINEPWHRAILWQLNP